MRDHHALRHSRGPGSEQYVGDVGAPLPAVQRRGGNSVQIVPAKIRFHAVSRARLRPAYARGLPEPGIGKDPVQTGGVVRQDAARLARANNAFQAGGGERRVHGHIDAPRLQSAEDPQDRLDRLRQQHTHAVPRAAAGRLQQPRQLTRPLPQLAVSNRALAHHQRNGIRTQLRLTAYPLLKQPSAHAFGTSRSASLKTIPMWSSSSRFAGMSRMKAFAPRET